MQVTKYVPSGEASTRSSEGCMAEFLAGEVKVIWTVFVMIMMMMKMMLNRLTMLLEQVLRTVKGERPGAGLQEAGVAGPRDSLNICILREDSSPTRHTTNMCLTRDTTNVGCESVI